MTTTNTDEYSYTTAPTRNPEGFSPEDIAQQMAAFLAQGGTIQQVPIGASKANPQGYLRNYKQPTRLRGVIGRGTKAKPYQCSECGDTDESNRAARCHKCRTCYNRRTVERAAQKRAERAKADG